jgi:hypothetical protein
MLAMLRVRLGWAALWQGDTERAEAQYAAARALAQRHEIRTGLANALTGLGRVAQVRGESARAMALLTESLAMHTERGATQGVGEAQYGLGLAARDQGDAVQATAWLRESLAVRRAEDDRSGIATCLEGLATVAAGQGQPARTARLLGAAEALRQAIGSVLPLVERPAFEAAVGMARAATGQGPFVAAWAAGRALPLDEAIAEALGEPVLPPRDRPGGLTRARRVAGCGAGSPTGRSRPSWRSPCAPPNGTWSTSSTSSAWPPASRWRPGPSTWVWPHPAAALRPDRRLKARRGGTRPGRTSARFGQRADIRPPCCHGHDRCPACAYLLTPAASATGAKCAA